MTMHVLRLPSLLSSADLARLSREDICYSTAYEDEHIGSCERHIWRPPGLEKTTAKTSVAGGGSGMRALLAAPGDEDEEDDDSDFDPEDPESMFPQCPQWLFQKLTAAVQKGADRWPSALPGFAQGGVRYENIHANLYKVGDRKSWHMDAFPESKRPEGPPTLEDARALSVVVCLEPCESGGELEVVRGSAPEEPTDPEAISLDAGDAVVFPSKRLLHQISAVTRGQRKSIAFFACTPGKVVAAQEDEDGAAADSDSNSDSEEDSDSEQGGSTKRGSEAVASSEGASSTVPAARGRSKRRRKIVDYAALNAKLDAEEAALKIAKTEAAAAAAAEAATAAQ